MLNDVFSASSPLGCVLLGLQEQFIEVFNVDVGWGWGWGWGGGRVTSL